LTGWASDIYNDFLASLGYSRTIGTFIDNGIYAINGPNSEDDYALFCATYEDLCRVVSYEFWTSYQPFSVKSMEHWAQNFFDEGFNEFKDIWPSRRSSQAVDVSNIKGVPMSFFIGENDSLCTKTDAMNYIAQMQITSSTHDV